MRFTFVDHVLEIQPGVKITTLKCLSLGEEYLADHFPRFPVMPGVLMLEAMTEASAWLIRATDDFSDSIVTLKEARNIRFADFVQPGRVLTVTAEIVRSEGGEVHLKTQGSMADKPAVSGRLILERYNLADTRAEMAPIDAYLKRHLKVHFALICQQPLGTQRPGDVAAGGSALLGPLGTAAEPSRDKV